MANAVIAALTAYTNKSIFYPVVESVIARTLNNPEIFEFSEFGLETSVREFVGANAVDYDPDIGFTQGAGGEVKWTKFQPRFDRQVPIKVDAVQELNSIAQGMMLSGVGLLASSYKNLAAELDAVSFSSIFGSVPEANKLESTTAWSADEAFNTLIDIESNLFNAGVRGVSFVYIASSKFGNVLKALTSNNLAANPTAFKFVAGEDGEEVDIEIVRYNDLLLVRVPDNRFYTKVILMDGTSSGQEAGGFSVDPTAKPLTALVVPYDAGSFSYRHIVSNFSVPQRFASQLPVNTDVVKREIADNLKNQVLIENIGINQTADRFVYNNRTIYDVALFDSYKHALYAYYPKA